MQKYLNIVRGLLLLACTLSFSGCAVFNGQNVPMTVLTPLEKSEQQKPSVAYDISAMSGLVTVDKSPEHIQSIIAGEFLQTLEQSNYFGRIAKNDGQADISLSIQVKNTGTPVAMIPALITGLSLYTIPSWATDTFEVTATAKNKQGLSKQYVLTDSTTLVQWLPMVFVFPFKNFAVVPEVRKNMYRNILAKMKDDGFLTNDSVIKTSAVTKQ